MSETTDKIVDKIVDTATSRLKIPIVSTYIVVLMFQNWDIIYFLLFSKQSVESKILKLKTDFRFEDYILRVGGSLLIAIFFIIIFTLIDYYLIKLLKKYSIKKKEYLEEIASNKILKTLETTNQILSIENEKNKKENEKIQKVNNEFTTIVKDLNLKISNNETSVIIGDLIQKFPNNTEYYPILITMLKYSKESENFNTVIEFVEGVKMKSIFVSDNQILTVFNTLSTLGYFRTNKDIDGIIHVIKDESLNVLYKVFKI